MTNLSTLRLLFYEQICPYPPRKKLASSAQNNDKFVHFITAGKVTKFVFSLRRKASFYATFNDKFVLNRYGKTSFYVILKDKFVLKMTADSSTNLSLVSTEKLVFLPLLRTNLSSTTTKKLAFMQFSTTNLSFCALQTKAFLYKKNGTTSVPLKYIFPFKIIFTSSRNFF